MDRVETNYKPKQPERIPGMVSYGSHGLIIPERSALTLAKVLTPDILSEPILAREIVGKREDASRGGSIYRQAIADVKQSKERKFSYIPPANLRKGLVDTLTTVRLANNRLAQAAGVSQSFISNLLNGTQPIRDSLRVARVADVIEGYVKLPEKQEGLSDENIVKIKEVISSLRELFGIVKQELVYSYPGQVVSPDVRGFIERSVLKRIKGDFNSRIYSTDSFFTGLLGAPQSGVTTILQAVASLVDDYPERKVLTFDCRTAVNRSTDPQEQTKILFQTLTELAAYTYQIDFPNEVENKSPYPGSNFVRYLEGNLPKKHRGYILILDGISDLDPQTQLDLLYTLEKIHESSLVGRLLNRAISSFVGFSPRSYQDWDVLNSGYIGTALHTYELGWFSEQEVGSLLKSLGGDSLKSHERALWNYFAGQPYLTHLTADKLLKNPDLGVEAIVKQEIFESTGGYRDHFKAFKKLIAEPRHRLILEGIAAGELPDQSLHNDDIRYLSDVGVIKPISETPSADWKYSFTFSSPFYRDLFAITQKDTK